MKDLSVFIIMLFVSMAALQAQTYKVGDEAFGGVIFQINEAEGTGVVCSVNHQDQKYFWADAEKLCADLEEGGYSNWRLPSESELRGIYANLQQTGKYNFVGEFFWGESHSAANAWFIRFHNGEVGAYTKTGHYPGKILPVRTFKIAKNTLKAGETLKTGEKLISDNGAYMLRMQEDGNLCIYKHDNGKQGAFVWCSMAHGFKGAKLMMQTDGNLVVYDEAGTAKWNSKTHPYHDARFKSRNLTPVKLVLEDDGKLNLYNAKGKVVWTNE